MLCANWILCFESFHHTTIAIPTLCCYMAPLLVVVVAPIFLKEKLTVRKIICVLAALIGMVCISGVPDTGMPQMSDLRGILFGLAASVPHAVNLLMDKKITDVPVYDKTLVQLLVTAVVMLGYCLRTDALAGITVTGVSAIKLLILGCFHTGLAYSMIFGAMKYVSGQTVAILSYISPAFAVLISVFILREPITVFGVIGAVIILSASILSEAKLPARKPQKT